MSNNSKNEPAFPGGVNSAFTDIETGEPTQPGMTLRDYFAAKALQGDWAAEGFAGDLVGSARVYYAMADAMLAARNEPKKDE